jgi:GTP-binding protein LepA
MASFATAAAPAMGARSGAFATGGGVRRGLRSAPRRLGATRASPGRLPASPPRADATPVVKKKKEAVKVDPNAVLQVPAELIRNFSIIAHIDHGKSTLADTLLVITKTVATRDMEAQLLDSMDIERERGITIKLNSARMNYTARDGKTYVLNLIDTPGHVDFSYEVSRSLAACEGALLVVDSSQGVEAQTVANVYLALDADLEIIPVLNKIDLPGSEPDRVKREIEDVLGLDASDAVQASAKANIGMEDILEQIVARVPPPADTAAEPLRALIFDSYFDPYRGVVVIFRVVDGTIGVGDQIKLMNTGATYGVDEIGIMKPEKVPVNRLSAGEVGYFIANIKSVADARVGDTITSAKASATEALPGYSVATPMVYCGLFPTDSDQYEDLREALGKLQINDAALCYEPEQSSAMGFGFRCGFLGLLHMEIVQERLEREYDLGLITTAPSVVYKVHLSDGEVLDIANPADLPDASVRDFIEEPYVKLELITPADYVGTLMELSNQRRGEFIDMTYLSEDRTCLKYDIPLGEVVTDFFDELKSRSKGYASMEYSFNEYRKNDLIRLDVMINGEPAEPLACICHRDKSYNMGRGLVDALKELIPRQMFRIPIQAAIGTKVIASTSISAMRKDVLAKCYGGDISRKKKLLKKQAAGKKRMKQFGKVEVPQEAFMAVLQVDQNKNN